MKQQYPKITKSSKGTSYQKTYKLLSLTHTIIFSSIVLIAAGLFFISFLDASYPLLLRDVIYFNKPLRNYYEPPNIGIIFGSGISYDLLFAFLVTFLYALSGIGYYIFSFVDRKEKGIKAYALKLMIRSIAGAVIAFLIWRMTYYLSSPF